MCKQFDRRLMESQAVYHGLLAVCDLLEQSDEIFGVPQRTAFVVFLQARVDHHLDKEDFALPRVLAASPCDFQSHWQRLGARGRQEFILLLLRHLPLLRYPLKKDTHIAGFLVQSVSPRTVDNLRFLSCLVTLAGIQTEREQRLQPHEYTELLNMCPNEVAKRIFQFGLLKEAGADRCQEVFGMSSSFIASLHQKVPDAIAHFKLIQEIAKNEVSAKVRVGAIKHPVHAVLHVVRRLMQSWRVLQRAAGTQGSLRLTELIPDFALQMRAYVAGHGGLMKDRNCPISEVVKGPRLSLDRITDYAQQLAAPFGRRFNPMTLCNELPNLGVRLKNPKNDLMVFHFDSYFVDTNARNVLTWARSRSDEILPLSYDRKSKLVLGDSGDSGFGVWSLEDAAVHRPDHARSPLYGMKKLVGLSIACFSTKVGNDDRLLEYLECLAAQGISTRLSERGMVPFMVVHRDDLVWEQESGCANLNAVLYVLLRHAELLYSSDGSMKEGLVFEADAGHGSSMKEPEVEFCLSYIKVRLKLRIVIQFRHCPGQSAKDLAEDGNGAAELALTGQPINLSVRPDSVSADELNAAMEGARVEFIRRVHSQPCGQSETGIIALAPPDRENLLLVAHEIRAFLADPSANHPFDCTTYKEAAAALEDVKQTARTEYMLILWDPARPYPELKKWGGAFPLTKPSVGRPGKLARVGELLFQLPVSPVSEFDTHRAVPLSMHLFQKACLQQGSLSPILDNDLLQRMLSHTCQDAQACSQQWKDLIEDKKRGIRLEITEMENEANGIEAALEHCFGHPINFKGKSFTLANTNKASLLQLLSVVGDEVLLEKSPKADVVRAVWSNADLVTMLRLVPPSLPFTAIVVPLFFSEPLSTTFDCPLAFENDDRSLFPLRLARVEVAKNACFAPLVPFVGHVVASINSRVVRLSKSVDFKGAQRKLKLLLFEASAITIVLFCLLTCRTGQGSNPTTFRQATSEYALGNKALGTGSVLAPPSASSATGASVSTAASAASSVVPRFRVVDGDVTAAGSGAAAGSGGAVATVMAANGSVVQRSTTDGVPRGGRSVTATGAAGGAGATLGSLVAGSGSKAVGSLRAPFEPSASFTSAMRAGGWQQHMLSNGADRVTWLFYLPPDLKQGSVLPGFVPPDGNCGPHTTSYALQGNIDRHLTLRGCVGNIMKKFAEFFKEICENEILDYEEEIGIATTSKKQWGPIQWLAAATHTQRRITVFGVHTDEANAGRCPLRECLQRHSHLHNTYFPVCDTPVDGPPIYVLYASTAEPAAPTRLNHFHPLIYPTDFFTTFPLPAEYPNYRHTEGARRLRRKTQFVQHW
jgi:hypothetical protein